MHAGGGHPGELRVVVTGHEDQGGLAGRQGTGHGAEMCGSREGDVGRGEAGGAKNLTGIGERGGIDGGEQPRRDAGGVGRGAGGGVHGHRHGHAVKAVGHLAGVGLKGAGLPDGPGLRVTGTVQVIPSTDQGGADGAGNLVLCHEGGEVGLGIQ